MFLPISVADTKTNFGYNLKLPQCTECFACGKTCSKDISIPH